MISSAYFPTSTYFVLEKSNLKIGDQEYETTLSYNLFIESFVSDDFELIISRTNFKVNDKKIDTKFLKISNQYMEALFPVKCRVENYRVKIVNFLEMRAGIQKVDDDLQDKYSGEGIVNIRNQFLNATENDKKLAQFINELPFMRILNIGIQKFERKQDYFIKWNILAIGDSEWKGAIIYSKDENKLLYEPKIDNAQEIMNEIIRHVHENEYQVDFEEENVGLFADFKQEIKYTGETGRMQKAETEVCIEIENKFFYRQKITLQNK